MKKSFTTSQAQPNSGTRRPTIVLASRLMLLLIATFAFVQGTNAQCFFVETGDITGNVPYGTSINWANPNRVEISDDLYARTSLNAGDTTKYLSVSDFNYFIPATATILGIEVRIEVHEDDGADANDASLRLAKGSTPVGNDYAGTGIWESKDTTNLYGSMTDLWGETWTPADINDPDFGVLYSVTRLSGSDNLYVNVDYVTVTVYFTDESCLLPVSMTSFSAAVTPMRQVQLDWTTASESNNSHFSIERSQDGSNFSEVGTLAGSGTSSEARQYTFVDESPAEGANLYRLRQVDFDGKATYTEIVSATLDAASQLEIMTYPNPASDQLHIQVNMAAEKLDARLYDLNGREVMALTSPSAGSAAQMDLSSLQSGLYVLKVDADRQQATTKVIKR